MHFFDSIVEGFGKKLLGDSRMVARPDDAAMPHIAAISPGK
jgi:hypothetical protein